MDAVAKELGMSTDDLQKALSSGQSMTDLAKKAGVSKDDLVTTIAATLPAQNADGSSVDPTAAASGGALNDAFRSLNALNASFRASPDTTRLPYPSITPRNTHEMVMGTGVPQAGG